MKQEVVSRRGDLADVLGVTLGPLVRRGVWHEMIHRDIARLVRWLVIGGVYQF